MWVRKRGIIWRCLIHHTHRKCVLKGKVYMYLLHYYVIFSICKDMLVPWFGWEMQNQDSNHDWLYILWTSTFIWGYVQSLHCVCVCACLSCKKHLVHKGINVKVMHAHYNLGPYEQFTLEFLVHLFCCWTMISTRALSNLDQCRIVTWTTFKTS